MKVFCGAKLKEGTHLRHRRDGQPCLIHLYVIALVALQGGRGGASAPLPTAVRRCAKQGNTNLCCRRFLSPSFSLPFSPTAPLQC